MNSRLAHLKNSQKNNLLPLTTMAIVLTGIALVIVVATLSNLDWRSPYPARGQGPHSVTPTRLGPILESNIVGNLAYLKLNDNTHPRWDFIEPSSILPVIGQFEKDHGKVVSWQLDIRQTLGMGENVVRGVYIVFEPKNGRKE